MKSKFTRLFRTMSAVLAVVLFSSLFVSAQTIKYPDSWTKGGFNLVESKASVIQVDYSVAEFTFEDAVINNESVKNLLLPGVFLPGDEGAPNLPGESRFVAIPTGATPIVKIVSQRTEVFHNVNIGCAPRIPLETETGPLQFAKNTAIYAKNSLYPAQPVRISEVSNFRGVEYVMLGITPFQYNPVTKDLIVYRDLQVQIECVGGNGEFGEQTFRSRFFDPIMSDMLLNYSSLPAVDYAKISESYYGVTENDECEYIIICPDGPEFQSWADTIKQFRTEQGILTKVFTLTQVGGNTTAAIEGFINNAYNNWTIKPSCVMLLGDYGTNPAKNIVSPIWDNYCVSDNIYGDIDGSDLMPEVAMSRITANDNNQLKVMITKFLNYERNPPTNPDFYAHPITALGWQTERWFQICSETVGGFFKNIQGKDPVRQNEIYQGTPGSVWSTATNTNTVVNFFGPNGLGYIPQSPSTLGGWTGGTASGINAAINAGSFILQHRDHGNETGWGEPSYTNSSINGLTNTDLTFIMSINCLTGKYNWGSECFTEKFHRYTKNGLNSGALGLLAASETSYSFVNDTYVWGVYDNWWPEFMPTYSSTPVERGILPCFGNAAGKYFLKQSSWPYNTSNKAVTYNLFHHHGESFSVIYSEVPQALAVTHAPEINEGETTYEVTATAGATIALSVNGNIIGVQTATLVPNVFNLPADLVVGDNVVVVVTKTNYNRYRSLVPVTTEELIATFTSSATSGCTGLLVDFSDISSGDPISWEWTFDGGTPATSTEQNPSVQYNSAGNFNVTLKVGDGTDFHTTTLNAYVSTFDVPAAPLAENKATCVFEPVPDLTAEGEQIRWYADAELTTLLFSGNSFATGENMPGTYTYYATQTATVCEGPATVVTLTISDLPVINVSPLSPVCSNTAAFDLTGATPEGGTWSGNGVAENKFDATVAGIGDHTLTYTFTNEFGCLASSETIITVNNIPEVTLAALPAICQNAEPITLTGGLPEGGVYSGTGVEAGLFTPSTAGAGEIAIAYTVTDALTTCANTAITNILVNGIPELPFAGDTSICHNHTLTLDATYPNATYAWSSGETTATLVVDSTGAGIGGSKEVSVNVTTAEGCTTSANVSFTFLDCTGIGELAKVIGLEVYPNPTDGNFNLQISTPQPVVVDIKVVNAYGNLVYTAKSIAINTTYKSAFNLSQLADGVYFVTVESGNSSVSKKLIIKK